MADGATNNEWRSNESESFPRSRRLENGGICDTITWKLSSAVAGLLYHESLSTNYASHVAYLVISTRNCCSCYPCIRSYESRVLHHCTSAAHRMLSALVPLSVATSNARQTPMGTTASHARFGWARAAADSVTSHCTHHW